MKAAELYDLRTQHINSDREALRLLVGGREILEVGCGTGRILRWLLEWNSPRVVGIDMDGDKLAIARSRLAPGAPFELLEGDFLETPISGGTFERVLFPFNVLAELPGVEGRIAGLQRAGALIHPSDGRVVVMCFCHDFAVFAQEQAEHQFTIGGGDWSVRIACRRDRLRQLSECTVHYQHIGSGEVVTDRYRTALLTRNELPRMIHRSRISLGTASTIRATALRNRRSSASCG